MKEEEIPQSNERCTSPTDVSSQRVFKKSSPNNKLTIYLNSRDLYLADCTIDQLHGVVYVDPEYLEDKKVYGQITLTFRYGREDEEVMGLKFCNEAIMCLTQLYPPHERALGQTLTALQEALIKRLGPNAHAFTMSVTHLAPPSVQLVPSKEYNGAPIGTSYDIRAYIANRPDEKQFRRSTVRMGLRVLQRASRLPSRLESAEDIQQVSELELVEPPHVTIEKPFILSDGKIELEARLDKSIYYHGETVAVTVTVRNNSKKTVRRIKVFIVQHVDVCMFSNGKFKNVVAFVNSREECPLAPWSSLTHTYYLHPAKGTTKNWIALEDSFNKTANVLASTVTCASNSPEDRNVFAIYVSYYVKVKILVSAMGGEMSLKLPFTLTHSATEILEPFLLEAKQAEEQAAKRAAIQAAEEVSRNVKVECHDRVPKDKNQICNVFSGKCPTNRTLVEDLNEIKKCEEEKKKNERPL